ncbi:MAG: 2-hydroxyacid dehydrogenase [Alphaproteobacteria bacterium]
MTKIAFFDTKPYDKESFLELNKDYNFEFAFFENKLRPETISLVDGADVVCAFVNDTLSSEVIDGLANRGVKIVALRCAGYNNVDFKAAYNKIHVVRVPAYSPYAVAEHAVALMLALNRKIHKAFNKTRESNFTLFGLMGFDMHQKTAGVIGTGKIGKTLIGILKGFGMNVLASDAFPDTESAQKMGYEYVSLDEIYAKSDIISLNCPLTKETTHLINSDTISKMKNGVMIINTGRGKLIDTNALIEGLKSRKIGAAGLDVYEEESDYFFSDFSNDVLDDDKLARLLSFGNAIVTAHQAFFTKEAIYEIAKTTLDNIKFFFENEELPNEICYRCDKYPCNKGKNKRCF